MAARRGKCGVTLYSINDGAVLLHELYTSYVAAGFTPEQAMQLVIADKYISLAMPSKEDDE